MSMELVELWNVKGMKRDDQMNLIFWFPSPLIDGLFLSIAQNWLCSVKFCAIDSVYNARVPDFWIRNVSVMRTPPFFGFCESY